ncbi:hypothetical protein C8Q70DRAFT_1016334 [Cubamyces menziesii]|uniref:Zn(2)-C6 fungal-type domain-containing protein n=1 Tax=Trametes cubensis TaxID=1111947 RepID=A0AAD7XDR8_9APHY|nr:hypothetical protein C8Q70DRAFT_1016334 [Cubamyces menziesii]KAJ8489072.1 hypothetical protein ONZ51_g3146 [Trametes cubensis]
MASSSSSTFVPPQLDDLTSVPGSALGFEYSDLFSSATQPTFQTPHPDDWSSSPGILSPIDRASSAQPSSSASSPPSTSGSATSNPRKRIRPTIALAPGQPPTARGNDRIRVYVACHECRARKIRCDGAKPVCFQCQKRPSESGACTYDTAPNRKGHTGRRVGTTDGAQRASQTKRRRTITQRVTSGPANESDPQSSSSDTEPRAPGSNPQSTQPVSPERDDDGSRAGSLGSDADQSPEYDPFAFDFETPESFLSPGAQLTRPSSQEGQHDNDDDTIPSRPSVQFARETWWDALLAFYAFERDTLTDMQAVTLTAEQRHNAMRFIISDLRALFQSAASWMSFIHLPRFFEMVLKPSRRMELQPSLLLGALALGTLTQSSEIERGRKGRQRAIKLLDMAHGALQSSLSTGWVDVGLAQAGWMLLYFEMNSHPLQTWERTQSAMSLLDSLVRLFSLTTLDISYQRVGVPLTSSGNGFSPQSMHGTSILNPVYSAPSTSNIPSQLGTDYPTQYGPQNADQWTPQPNPHAFNPAIQNPFYANNTPFSNLGLPQILQAVSSSSSMSSGPSTRTSNQDHHSPRRRGCDCARFSLGQNWPSVREFAPSWSTTLMWPINLTEAEFKKEECRRLVWASVMMVASLNAYASVTPDGVTATGRMFVKEHESFALLTPSETLVQTGVPLEADDVWSLSLRSMLLLHSCLRVRASPLMSGAQRAEFAVRAWLEIDDLERRMQRHTCNLSSNYGFQSEEMLFSLRICVSYEFQRFIPQITTSGNALFYRDKAEGWLRHLDETVREVWKAMQASFNGNSELDHRKSLFIFWYMSGIKKCIILWKADPTLYHALTSACQSAEHLEHFLLYWPSDRVRHIWQGIRYELVKCCIEAGVPPPPVAIPRPMPRKADPPPTVVA